MTNESSVRVYVDAKIIGSHDKTLRKRTLVAYLVDGSRELQAARKIEGVAESDEAEMEAVAFAIEELKEKLETFTIVCDHKSVVSEILRGETRPRSRHALSKIQANIRANPSIKVKWLEKNPAHKLLNEFEAEIEKR